jgi:hypothetical protein
VAEHGGETGEHVSHHDGHGSSGAPLCSSCTQHQARRRTSTLWYHVLQICHRGQGRRQGAIQLVQLAVQAPATHTVVTSNAQLTQSTPQHKPSCPTHPHDAQHCDHVRTSADVGPRSLKAACQRADSCSPRKSWTSVMQHSGYYEHTSSRSYKAPLETPPVPQWLGSEHSDHCAT